MATTLPVQKASFRGLYETVGGIFTPKPLEWTLADYDLLIYDPNFEFRNTRGLTFVLIKINYSPVSWILGLRVFKTIDDIPINLELGGVTIVISSLPGQKQNIIGPFSYVFDANEIVQFSLRRSGIPMLPNESLSLAVISLPHGSI